MKTKMNVIALRRLREFWELHPKSERSLRVWYKRLRKSQLENYADLSAIFASADLIKQPNLDDLTIFNVGGNKFRVVVVVVYHNQTAYIKHVFTHPEYTAWNKGGKTT
jgi:mRNA interferase HigB